MQRVFLSSLVFLIFSNFLNAQIITQTVRGNVKDAITHEPLLGATIFLLNSDPSLGTSCDVNGNFELKNVPVGRQSIEVRMIGYDTYIEDEIMVNTGNETFLNVFMQTSSVDLSEVVVKTYTHNITPINTMSTLSARKFTVEETQRYAGGMDDPARLVSSFAGVATPAVSSNGISVRGNNPQGLLWRIEGVEVPNPNHFANLTVVGGGVLTTISNQMMTKSDFFLGAFPAEYGNASSGVFDINLKTGNPHKREYTFQAGVIGIDFAAEGPFIKNNDASSYAINYRYSTLGLIAPLLPSNAGVIKYQDLSFKTNFRTKKVGTISVWGIGAFDEVKTKALEKINWEADFDRDNADDKLYMFATGISNKIQLGEKTFLNSTFSISGSSLSHDEKRLDSLSQFHPNSNIKNKSTKLIFQSVINHRFGEKHSNRSGFSINQIRYNVDIEKAPFSGLALETLAQGNGEANYLQAYSQSKIYAGKKSVFNVGLHYLHFLLNNNYSIEPRLGYKYTINKKQSIALAYGLHSRLELLPIYFVKINDQFPNKNLKLMQASHYVLSYNIMFNENLNLNFEPYFQNLKNIPVSPYNYNSTINIENNLFFSDQYVSKGKGRNFGIDISLERFIKNGFYYLFTASIFDSKYTGIDGIQRNTRYNKNYVFNALMGKEWEVGNLKNNIFGLNFRLNYAGGNRLEPIDEKASLQAKEIIYSESEKNVAFSNKLKDLPVFSFTITYRKNKPNFSSIWSLKVLNATVTKEFVADYYNLKTNTLDKKYDGIFIPNLSYKIEF